MLPRRLYRQKKPLGYYLINSEWTLENLLSVKSAYNLPFCLFPIKATYLEVINYLKENCGLVSCEIWSSRNDFLPTISITTTWVNGNTGHALSMNRHEISVSKAIGEGLERFLLSNPKLTDVNIRTRRYSDLSHMKTFPSFLKEQSQTFPYLFSEKNQHEVFETVECLSLFSGEKIDLPTQYIFWLYKNKKEPKLVPQTTNGAGAHFTYEEAVLSGLHEEIQRDTFLFYWLLKKEPKRIEISSIKSKDLEAVLENLIAKGLDVNILALENESGVPVFLSLLIDRRSTPTIVSLGAGTDSSSYERAIESALYESIGVSNMSAAYAEERRALDESYRPFFDKTINRPERIALWTGDWAEKNIQFLLGGEKISLQSLAGEIVATQPEKLLEEVVGRLKNNVSDIYVYPVDSPHLKRLGYFVVKVIVPDFLQIHLTENQATLSSLRLAKELKKSERDITIKDFNPLPHLFP